MNKVYCLRIIMTSGSIYFPKEKYKQRVMAEFEADTILTKATGILKLECETHLRPSAFLTTEYISDIEIMEEYVNDFDNSGET